MAVSFAEPFSAATPAPVGGRWFACAAWVFVAALSLLQTALHPQAFFLSTDDAMRLSEVRDLMAGQNWFDLTQARMNTPFGVEMHWSHLVDAGIAALIFVFRIFTDARTAETAAVWTWPLLMLLPVYLALTAIGKRVAGRDGALIALLLGASCLALFGIFQPGRIDHHNVQLALGISMLACLIARESPARMAAAGGLAALGFAVGIEALPFVLLAGAVVAGIWVIEGDGFKIATRAFGVALAVAAALLFFGATATMERVTPLCDTYSLFYAPLVIAGGAGLTALSYAKLQTWQSRAFAIAGVAAVLLVLAAGINPDCLAGPFGEVDIRLDKIWLSRIEEAQPAWRFAILEPGYFVSGYLYGAAGFAATLAAIQLGPKDLRGSLAVLALFSAMALGIATFEVRGMNFAILFGLPGMAAFVGLVAARVQDRATLPGFARAATVMLTLFVASNVAFDLASRAFAATAKREQAAAHNGFACFQSSTLQSLNALPKSRIAAFIDQGPGILSTTQHAVIAGPYHRDVKGVLDTYAIFAGDDARARQIIAQRGIDYVVICPASPDYAYYAGQGGSKGLIARLQHRDMPSWLTQTAISTPQLQVFHVVRDRL